MFNLLIANIKELSEYIHDLSNPFCILSWIAYYEVQRMNEVLCLFFNSHFLFFGPLLKTSYFLHFLNSNQHYTVELTPCPSFKRIAITTSA